jgi:hypothetical protein
MRKLVRACWRRGGFVLAGLGLGLMLTLAARADQAICTDGLQNSWENWSWDTTADFNSTAQIHSGASSAAATITAAWGAFYFYHPDFSSAAYTNVSFWIHGGASGGQKLQLQGILSKTNVGPAYAIPTLPANTWQQITVSLGTLGVAGKPDLDGFWLQDRNGSAEATFYLDDMMLATSSTPPPTITLTSPANGANYLTPTDISLSATVGTNSHTITKVQFYNGAALLGEDASPPYSLTWSNVGAGTYLLKARLIYDTGSTLDTSSAVVRVVSNAPVTMGVDVLKNRHAISPLIYGVAFAGSSNFIADLNAPAHRSGGNSETRYNWQLNAHNHAGDWYFESIADDGPTTTAASANDFIAQSKGGGADAMLTIPMIGWPPKLGPSRGKLASFSIGKYGQQDDHDWQWYPDAGNGVVTNSNAFITGNDPNDASFLTNSDFQRGFVRYLTNRWGVSTNGGVRYYLMDNEVSIWQSTHRDVHPIGPTMQEIRDKFFDYAGMVKGVDPSAVVLAPEEWGWSGYFYSGYDQQYGGQHGYGFLPDRSTNGGWDYCPWLLDQFRQRATNTNQRLLDYFTLHYYPQSGEFGSDVSTSMQLLRNRSTRSLWDTNYVDESWINSVVMLVPRMKGWVAAYYPGTKIGVTEYNWGAESHINGATAQADIYGIFGREGLDLGTRWTTPTNTSPTYKAMKMYRNYDGNKSGFGETSVLANGPNPDLVSTFAAVRASDGALTIMAINKQLLASAPATIGWTNFLPSGTAQVWRLSSANAITRLSDIAFTGNTLSNTLPAQSITLFVVGAGGPPHLRPGTVAGNTFDLWLDGVVGQRYAIQAGTNLVNWTSVQTNTLGSNSVHLVVGTGNWAYRFYRAKWMP